MKECKVYAGSSIRATVAFQDPDTLVLTDVIEPVTIRVFYPDGSSHDNPGQRISTGTYRMTFIATQAGDYRASAKSSGTEPAVAEAEIHAYPSGFET